MKSTSRPGCLFCGAAGVKMTKEHVLPHHWKGEFPTPRSGKTTVQRTLKGRTVVERPETSSYDSVVKAICAPCNNGWMREIDEEIKPLISGLAWKRQTVIPRDSVDLFGRWVKKVALLHTRVDKRDDQGAPLGQFAHFFATKDTPMFKFVQLGQMVDCDDNLAGNTSFTRRKGFSEGELGAIQDRANIVTLRIGGLFFQVGLSSGTDWSTTTVKRGLATCRLTVPYRLVPLRSGADFNLPRESIMETETLEMRNLLRTADRQAWQLSQLLN